MKGPLFFAKILLFGEYGIIKDSKGLSIPYNFYRGALKIPTEGVDFDQESNQKLKDFAVYLKTLDSKVIDFDWVKLESDLAKNMYFDSSIPQGYGVGSSGALVAAIYDQYASCKITVLENLTKEKLGYLKKVFSLMESFFHGKSSGLDPLNSYLSLPILIHSKENIQTTGIPSQHSMGKGAVFLLDSGKTGETAPMVSMFMENMKKEAFSKMMRDQFIKRSDACVEDFLKGNIGSLFKNIKSLSALVLNNFQPMIPDAFHQLWQQGIETNDYYLKLCGSGGGGFILGFAQDFDKAKKALEKYPLEVVYHF
ncbi:mevalonate kinase [Flavobacteriaceae bacterium]|nr:mevalonate kinase [Flavobacteriaceae bacterium]